MPEGMASSCAPPAPAHQAESARLRISDPHVETVRDLTQSRSPLSKRLADQRRCDLQQEIDEIQVAATPVTQARDFMKMLMPQSAAVKQYRDGQPLFSGWASRASSTRCSRPPCNAPGGYIVIDQTEALVSIDVNSAVPPASITSRIRQTNLEAAEEVARASPARPRGADRHRLHRHGREAQQPRGRAQAE